MRLATGEGLKNIRFKPTCIPLLAKYGVNAMVAASITRHLCVCVTNGFRYCMQSFFMSPRNRRYCFTINNYSEEDVARLEALGNSLERISYIIFGREVADSGTPHLQGYVIFRNAVSLQVCKRTLGERGHYERAIGTSSQCASYCKKDDDFQEFGTLPTKGGTRSDLDEVFDWGRNFANEHQRAPSSPEIAREYPGVYTRYQRVSRTIRFSAPAVALQRGELNGWQRNLHDELMEYPDDRKIRFVVDFEGGKGKSWFQRYMVTKYPEKVQLLGIGKRDDMTFAIDETKMIFFINVPRGSMEFLQYTVLEQLKDRIVFSTKYTTRTKVFPTNVHVVIFSNENPDMTAMTNDRYVIIEL